MSLELLSLGLNFVGGMMGQRSSSKAHRQQLRQSQAQFDAQMDQTVQRRVKDAKAAGVHPLFALGSSMGASPTISSGQAPTGNHMGNALQRMAAALGVIEQNKASARRDEAQAALFDSERKRIEQELVSRGHDDEKLQEINVMPKHPHSFWQDYANAQKNDRPLYIPVKDQRTGQTMYLFNPELGLDEVGQLLYLNQQGKADRDNVIQWLRKKAPEIISLGEAKLREIDRKMRDADAQIKSEWEKLKARFRYGR